MAETLADSYSESNRSADYYLDDYDGVAIGQAFSPSVSGPLTSCKWYLRKEGSPTGSATARIYASTGSAGARKPTGSPLATSTAIDVSTLSTSQALITFTFSTPYTVTAGTWYIVTFHCPSIADPNFVCVGYDDTSPSHSGNASNTYDGSTWVTYSGEDFCFYVYVTAGQVKSVAGQAWGACKKVAGIAVASIKKIAGLST